MKPVLLWDFDGTLGERPGKWNSAVLTSLDELLPGHTITREDITPVLKSGFLWHEPHVVHTHLTDPVAWWEHNGALLERALLRLTVPPAVAHAAARRVRAHYTDVTTWRLYDDTTAALHTLTGHGWRHAIVSNHVPELPEILAGLGIADCFEAVVNSAVTGYEKPHPHAFRLALAATGNPRAVWMVGDNPRADVHGAAAAGIEGILVRSARQPGMRHYPDLTSLAAALTDR